MVFALLLTSANRFFSLSIEDGIQEALGISKVIEETLHADDAVCVFGFSSLLQFFFFSLVLFIQTVTYGK